MHMCVCVQVHACAYVHVLVRVCVRVHACWTDGTAPSNRGRMGQVTSYTKLVLA